MKPASSQPKPFNAIPKRQRDFVKEYVRTGDAKEAYLLAGYKDSRSTMARASALLKEVTPYLQQANRDFLEGVEMAILGGKVVRELATNATNETVRLNAAKELLVRAAPEKPKESKDERIRALQDELFIDAPKATVVNIK